MCILELYEMRANDAWNCELREGSTSRFSEHAASTELNRKTVIPCTVCKVDGGRMPGEYALLVQAALRLEQTHAA